MFPLTSETIYIFFLVRTKCFVHFHIHILKCFVFSISALQNLLWKSILLVIRFMTDLLRKYRGQLWSWWGEAEPSFTLFTTDPLYFRSRSVINLITNLLHRGPFITYFKRLGRFNMVSLLNEILTSLFLSDTILSANCMVYSKRIN